MCARRYTKTQHLLPVIEEMIAAGKTHKEIEREWDNAIYVKTRELL